MQAVQQDIRKAGGAGSPPGIPDTLTTPRRWFVRGLLVGILISAALNAVSFFFRSERGGNLLGTAPDHYEALGFPWTLWEIGNSYGGLFIDLPALLVNAVFAVSAGVGCGLLALRFRSRLNELVERLEQVVAAPRRGRFQFTLRGLLTLSSLAAVAAAGAHYALAGNPAVLGIIYGLGPWLLVLISFVPTGLAWQQRVAVLVPTALLLMLAAVATAAALRPPLEFDKVLLYIFVCWTPQSVLVALVLSAGLVVYHTRDIQRHKGFSRMDTEPDRSDLLCKRVEQIARRLDDDLRDAFDLTDRWRDADLTDRLAGTALQRALDQLGATGCWSEANRLPSSTLWRIAGPWLETGSLQLRARTKPRGYAGDFEMLTQIGANRVCDHPLGAAFDRYFQAQAAPQAVRNRTALVAEAVAGFVQRREAGPVRVVSVGSGPALDLQQACCCLTPPQRQRLQIALVDLDPAALDYAESQLAPLVAPARVRLVRENLFRLAQPARSRDFLDGADMLVCTGLFDYLDAAAAVALLSRFWQALRPGGQAWVFNFAPHNPSRAYMEWIGNWYLIYRTAEQMCELAAQAGIPHQHFQVSAEPSGVNLYWHINRPAATDF
jgi:extracellular factor (EF) 3-hydroxypalmitic acid methyl ester biosynthesis protein